MSRRFPSQMSWNNRKMIVKIRSYVCKRLCCRRSPPAKRCFLWLRRYGLLVNKLGIGCRTQLLRFFSVLSLLSDCNWFRNSLIVPDDECMIDGKISVIMILVFKGSQTIIMKTKSNSLFFRSLPGAPRSIIDSSLKSSYKIGWRDHLSNEAWNGIQLKLWLDF